MNRVLLLLGLFLLAPAPALAAITADFEMNGQSAPLQCPSPCWVFFDATEDLDDPDYPLTDDSSSGVVEEIDVHFSWDFGDPGSGMWTYSGKSKNRAYGPYSGHLYELSPTATGSQTFTVTLEVTAPNGATDTATRTVTVTAANTHYAGRTVCVARSDSFGGCPGSNHLVDTGSYEKIVEGQQSSGCGGNGCRRILFRGGQTWTATNQTTVNGARYDPTFVGSFGTGKPTFRYEGSGNNGFQLNGGVLADVILDRNNKIGYAIIGSNPSSKGGLALRTESSGAWGYMANLGGSSLNDLHQDFAFVENQWEDTGSYGVFTAVRRMLVLGNRIDTPGDEHTIRMQQSDSTVISHNSFTDSPKHIITFRQLDCDESDNASCNKCSRNGYVSDNYIKGREAWVVHMSGTGGSGKDFACSQSMLFERNFFATFSGSGVQRIIMDVGPQKHMAIRHNIVRWDSVIGYKAFNIDNNNTMQGHSPSHIRIHNNTCYTPDATSSTIECVSDVPGNSEWMVSNNLVYAPKATGSVSACKGTGCDAGNLRATLLPFVAALPGNLLGLATAEQYKLKLGAIGIDAGTSLGSPARVDYGFGQVVPGSIDVGAWEYGAPPADGAPPPAERLDPPDILPES